VWASRRPAQAPATSEGLAPVVIKGSSEGGITEAGGLARDLGVTATRNGYRTHYTVTNIWVRVPIRVEKPGAEEYYLIPGVIIGLSFTPVPSCVDPIPTEPSVSADNMTRAERAAYNAAHPSEPSRPRPSTAAEILADLTGVGAVVDCIQNAPSAAASSPPQPSAPPRHQRALSRQTGCGEHSGGHLPAWHKGPVKSQTPRGRGCAIGPGLAIQPASPSQYRSPSRKRYIAIDTSKLPRDSVVPDGVLRSITTPPGHVSVYVDDVGRLRNAVIEQSRFPK
jgi:hypothetical protein